MLRLRLFTALLFLGAGCSSVGPARLGAPPEANPREEPPEGLALFHVPFQIGKTSLPRVRIASDRRSFETADGRPFVPFGLTYYRPGTGWAPQLWKQFDAEATRRDFEMMKHLGVNCVRVFLTYESFLRRPGELDPAGLAKFDQFLTMAEHAGIYVHPTGPDHWEGLPEWARTDRIADERHLEVLEAFWKQFATRYKSRAVILAYELLNEPEVGWDSEVMRPKWNHWLERKYVSAEALNKAWGRTGFSFDTAAAPEGKNAPGDPALLDYQEFRESLADDWTARQAGAIRSVDRDALITTGLIQWSVPALLASPKQYSLSSRRDRHDCSTSLKSISIRSSTGRTNTVTRNPSTEISPTLTASSAKLPDQESQSSWLSLAGMAAGSLDSMKAVTQRRQANSRPAGALK